MKINPLFDRVLILPTPEKESAGGLALPVGAQEKPYFGKVVAVGPGLDTEGKQSNLQVKTGDKVIYSKYGGVPIVVDKTEYIIMRQTDILAKYGE